MNENPNPNFSVEEISAAHNLIGKTLKSGWKVVERVKAKPGSSGGHFSVCYTAEKDGVTGFMKVLNVLAFTKGKGMLDATSEALLAFRFERDLCSRCKSKSFSRVSKMYESDEEEFNEFIISPVYYMIFEKAEADVRDHINFAKEISVAWKLRSLHNVATGIKQLHSIKVSHQDLKPSNVFVFGDSSFKIGDLGRSLSDDLKGPHSKESFSGDYRYAPPEVFHEFEIPDKYERIYAIDSYLLGSMASYYFTLQSINALMQKHINTNIQIYHMKFENALPYWEEAFDLALSDVKSELDGITDADEIISAVRMLSHPDPRKRGHIKNVAQIGSNFGMERFVEIFNLLARKAEFNLTH